MSAAAREVRYLVDRGYPKESAVRFVSDHHRLPDSERFILSRVVVAENVARARRGRAVSLEALCGRELFIDGYNVIITVESLLGGRPVYCCDDGFLRDAEGIFRRYKASELTMKAISEVLGLVACGRPSRSVVLLDQQISHSGHLAGKVREMMAEHSVQGTCKTAQDVDRQLKDSHGIIATGDGSIIDSVELAIDLPCEVARRLHINPYAI